jgi:hypothetical protein
MVSLDRVESTPGWQGVAATVEEGEKTQVESQLSTARSEEDF